MSLPTSAESFPWCESDGCYSATTCCGESSRRNAARAGGSGTGPANLRRGRDRIGCPSDPASGARREMARTLDLTGVDGLCVVGGDGTVHEVADGLMQRGETISVPLGVIPAGTGNTLAQHLQCDDPLEAARRIVAGCTQPLDVVRVTLSDEVVFCVDIVGWGAVSDINATAERIRCPAHHRYGAAALWQILRAKHRRATLSLDGQTIDDEFLFVMACNPKFTGSGMKVAPHAEIGDGKLDVVVVRRARAGRC